MQSEYSTHVYRPEIDGLRALAVVAVIINHFDSGILPSGYLGVDIFFVISGFVITSSLANHQSKTFGDFLLSFYVRRIKRLLPALVLFVIVSSFLICLFDKNPMTSLRTGTWSLFGLSNLFLLSLSTDYFAASTELNIFAHTWSLGVEEQFYLLFPFLAWVGGLNRRTTHGSRALLRATWLLSVLSFIGFLVFPLSKYPGTYFLMPTRLWELGAGCLLFLSGRHTNFPRQHLERIPPTLTIVGIVLVLFAPFKFAVPACVVIVILTVILISCVRAGTTAYRILTHPKVVFTGRISYSLYLWHWGVLALSRWTIGIEWWSAPFLTALMVLMAFLSYRFVESPLRKLNWSEKRIVSFLYGVSVSIGACGLLLVLSGPLYGRFYLGNLLHIASPLYLEQTWWGNRITGEYLEKCHIKGAFSSALLHECLEMSPGKVGTVYLIGDSHARNYLPALRKAITDHSTAYLTMGYGCAFLPPAMSSKYSSIGCPEYVEETMQYLLRKVRSGDIVFVGQLLADDTLTAVYLDFIKSFALRLKDKGVPLVLLDDVVSPALSPEECVDLPWTAVNHKNGCNLSSEVVRGAFSRFDQMVKEASNQVTSLYYAPLRMGLCYKGFCGQTMGNGVPIWHDKGGHITEAAAEELAPLLSDRLTELGLISGLATAPNPIPAK